jgi:hypothetical protein
MAEVAKQVETTAVVNATEEVKTVEVIEEQLPLCEETISVPAAEEMKFRCEWTLWEHYDAESG